MNAILGFEMCHVMRNRFPMKKSLLMDLNTLSMWDYQHKVTSFVFYWRCYVKDLRYVVLHELDFLY